MGGGALLLGFDAREMWRDYGRTWSAARRETFLLRADVAKPLSTDALVWRSALKEADRDELAANGNRAGLITDLAALRARLQARRAADQRLTWLIGITATLNWTAATPAAPEAGWRLLGYDVGDLSLLSGLMNCGYTDPQERETLAARFGGRLNEHHLFSAAEAAEEFRVLSNARVPEHAPFYVYGLYHIPNE